MARRAKLPEPPRSPPGRAISVRRAKSRPSRAESTEATPVSRGRGRPKSRPSEVPTEPLPTKPVRAKSTPARGGRAKPGRPKSRIAEVSGSGRTKSPEPLPVSRGRRRAKSRPSEVSSEPLSTKPGRAESVPLKAANSRRAKLRGSTVATPGRPKSRPSEDSGSGNAKSKKTLSTRPRRGKSMPPVAARSRSKARKSEKAESREHTPDRAQSISPITSPQSRRRGFDVFADIDTDAPTTPARRPRRGRAKRQRYHEPKPEPGLEDSESSSSGDSDSSDNAMELDNSDNDLSITPRKRRGRRGSRSSFSSVGSKPRTPKKRGRPRKGSPRYTPRPYGTNRKRRNAAFDHTLDDDIDEYIDKGSVEEALQFTNFHPEDMAIFMDRWAIIDKLRPIEKDAPCNRYLVTDITKAKESEADKSTMLEVDGILRCYGANRVDRVLQEFTFLDKMEKYNRSHLALTAFDMKFVANDEQSSFCYIVTGSRSSHTISELLQNHGQFSMRDTSRICTAIVEIFENISKIGYILLDVQPSHFALDVESGYIHLCNCTYAAPCHEYNGFSSKTGWRSLRWRGGPKYAPLANVLDTDAPMSICDSLEAMFYLILDLCGAYSIDDSGSEEMTEKKRRWSTADENVLAVEWPVTMVTFWLNLRRGRRYAFNRTDTLKNGYIMNTENREKEDGSAIPISCYLDYTVFYACLKTYGSIPCDTLVDAPWDFTNPEIAKNEILILGEMNRMDLESRQIESDVEFMNKEAADWLEHEKQLALEIRQNERFLHDYLGDDYKREQQEALYDTDNNYIELNDNNNYEDSDA